CHVKPPSRLLATPPKNEAYSVAALNGSITTLLSEADGTVRGTHDAPPSTLVCKVLPLQAYMTWPTDGAIANVSFVKGRPLPIGIQLAPPFALLYNVVGEPPLLAKSVFESPGVTSGSGAVPSGSAAIAVHVAPASTLFRPRAYSVLALFGSSDSVVLSALPSIWVHVMPASTLLNKPEDGVKRGTSPLANTLPSPAPATPPTLRPGGPLSDVQVAPASLVRSSGPLPISG